MFFLIHTLGCKLNQLETEAITDAFKRNGFSTPPELSNEPGIVIVNTCTVTSMAEQKARRIIRKFLKDYSAACLVVTGCYAQMDREIIEKEFPERVVVVPGDDKDRLLDLPGFLSEAGVLKIPPPAAAGRAIYDLISSWLSSVPSCLCEKSSQDNAERSFRFRPEKFSSHSRAFLKIQDGCNRRCSYCRVSLARGKSRSLNAEQALKELLALEQRGFNEAVLTGVNITQYMDSDMDLAGLLEFLLEGSERIRLRLSSIDPDRLNEKFFAILGDERIRPHFHLSLQSGSAAILAKMGRAYSPEEILKTAEQLRRVKDDPFLACDIIAAFPGETEEEFEQTKNLCGEIGFSWIHAFPFSPRPGTPAHDFSGRINEGEAKRRVETLTALARKGRLEYLERWKGKELEAVVEAGRAPGKHMTSGVSENYLKLLIVLPDDSAQLDDIGLPDYTKLTPGSLVKSRILHESPKNSRFDALAELIKVN